MRYRLFLPLILAAMLPAASYAQVEMLSDGRLVFAGEPPASYAYAPAPDMPQAAGEKNPWLAFVLSFVVPGLGQAYNGQYGKGTVQFMVSTVGLGMVLADEGEGDDETSTRQGLGAAMYLGGALWSMIDAPISANRISRENRQSAFGIYPSVGARYAGLSIRVSL